jgi:hypothetical protein
MSDRLGMQLFLLAGALGGMLSCAPDVAQLNTHTEALVGASTRRFNPAVGAPFVSVRNVCGQCAERPS